jgi:DNA-binding GntR family transcriptional regulator
MRATPSSSVRRTGRPKPVARPPRGKARTGEGKSKKAVVYEALKQRIMRHDLAPGEPLNEGLLSRELAISKTPVREAIQQLEKEGFIQSIPGRGAFVSRIEVQDLREMFELREILECEAIKRAAVRLDPGKLQAVRRAFELSETSSPRGTGGLFRSGDQIHAFIFEALGNARLLEIYRRLQEHIVRHRLHFFSKSHAGRPEASYREHLEILDALAAGDPERCERAMRTHLRNSLEYVKSII